jgi:cell division protein FtsQ
VTLVAMATAVIAAVVVAVLHSPVLSARHVVVEGHHSRTPTAAIISAAGLAHDPPLIDIDAGRAAASVTSLPWVASATVTVDWPDSVVVRVTQRTPVAAVAGPAGTWAELDRSGRTLEVVGARPVGIVALVVHGPSGVLAPAPVGRRVAPAAEPGLEVAATLPPAFSGQVTTITVAAAGTVDLALNSGLTVVLGTATQLHAKYEDIAAIIAGAPLRGAKEIDVAAPQSATVDG